MAPTSLKCTRDTRDTRALHTQRSAAAVTAAPASELFIRNSQLEIRLGV